MQKNNFIAQFIREMKVTHDLACPDMPDYTYLKWLSEFFASMDV